MNGYNHLNGHSNGAGAGQPSTSAEIQIPAGPTNQPRVHVRTLVGQQAVFQLSGVETGYANSLRRVMMADVPTIGESTSAGGSGSCCRSYSDLESCSRWDRKLSAGGRVGGKRSPFLYSRMEVPGAGAGTENEEWMIGVNETMLIA